MTDPLPDLEPVMLSGLTWPQAKAALKAVDCALRRAHWCSPVVILAEGKLTLDDDGELSPFEPAPKMEGLVSDRAARDWMMVPRVDDDGKPIPPTYRLPLEERAAQASFAEDHRLGARSWGMDASRQSIPTTEGAEGRNWAGE